MQKKKICHVPTYCNLLQFYLTVQLKCRIKLLNEWRVVAHQIIVN